MYLCSVKQNQIKRLILEVKDILKSEPEFPENEYNSISWCNFYKFKNADFELKNAVENSVDWKFPFKQMNNELYPGEGIMDNKHLLEISGLGLKYFGDENLEVYYTFLATNNWDEDKMYRVKTSELINLIENEDTEKTPSLIYSIDKNWAINTDIDLQFSVIGGNENFINELINNNPDEIYAII